MSEFSKIIWQHHKWEYKDLPDLYKKTTLTWQVMNPDWEYRYVSDKEIRNEMKKLNNPKLLDRFDREFDGMGKSDVYREAMVYEYGGLWSDLDAVCLFPIDEIIKNNSEKEMICLPPFTKFGIDEKNNYKQETIEDSVDKLLLGVRYGYWIANAVFLGKKHNKISKEIMKAMTEKWEFEDKSYMGMRAELYDKYHNEMSLDLLCTIHDQRLNLRNY
jgi:mannosyltransferase OCH1-like enzyme